MVTRARTGGSRLLVDLLDEAGQLERRGAHGSDRRVVVHPQRPQEPDGAEWSIGQAVMSADVGDVVQLGALDSGADANDRLARIERFGEELEDRGAPLEQPEQPVAR